MLVEVVVWEKAYARDERVKVNLERLVEVGPLKLKAFGGIRSIETGHSKLSLVKVLWSRKIDSEFKYVLTWRAKMRLSIFLNPKNVQISVIECTLKHEKGLAAVAMPDTILVSCLTERQVVSLPSIGLVSHRSKIVSSFCILYLLCNFSKLGEVISGVGICINSCNIDSWFERVRRWDDIDSEGHLLLNLIGRQQE